MELQKTVGITLSSRIVGEADILAEIFTRDFGKRFFTFKGLKKSKNRPKIISDPGTLSSLNYYFNENKRYTIVNEFTITNESRVIRDDYHKIMNLHFMVELVNKTTGENDPHPYLYSLLNSALKKLEGSNNSQLLSLVFILHIIKYHGILPDFSGCSYCGRNNEKEYYLILKEKTISCCNCCIKETQPIKINKNMKEFMIFAYNNKFEKIESHFNMHILEEEISKLLFILILFTEEYFHIFIKSKELLFNK